MVTVEITNIHLIQYAKVKNWNKKIDQFGGFGTGYSYALLSLSYWYIGTIASIAMRDPQSTLIWLGIGVVFTSVFFISANRLKIREIHMEDGWEIMPP